MTAGLYLQGRIWRFTYPSDDNVGGAVPSGTILYTPVYARIKSLEPTQALLEQGLETPEMFRAALFPGAMMLEHNDQFEVTYPPISSYYGKRFVIIGIQNSSMEDPRKYLLVTLRRIEKAHDNLLQ